MSRDNISSHSTNVLNQNSSIWKVLCLPIKSTKLKKIKKLRIKSQLNYSIEN